MTRFQVIYLDGSYTVYGTKKFGVFAEFCRVFFKWACAFPAEVWQIRKLQPGVTPARDIDDFDAMIDSISKGEEK